MRFKFTSAFIPTLLSASMVLAAGIDEYGPYPYPFAGYRVQTDSDRWFSHVSAEVLAPRLFWNPFTCLDQRAFIAVAIGDPLTCGGLEAGIRITCTGEGTAYVLYWQLFPGDPHILSDAFPINVNDRIYMEVEIGYGGVLSVLIENRTTNRETGKLSVDTVDKIGRCRTTAGWVLGADLMGDGAEVRPPPGFQEIYFFDAIAMDYFVVSYYPAQENHLRMSMRDSLGVIWATPFVLWSLTSFSIM